jgi:hypothetical protein
VPSQAPAQRGFKTTQLAYFLNAPDDIEDQRRRLFGAIEPTVTLLPSKWATLWPFVSNVWIRAEIYTHARPARPITSALYRCANYRVATRRRGTGETRVNRQAATHEACEASVRVETCFVIENGYLTDSIDKVSLAALVFICLLTLVLHR